MDCPRSRGHSFVWLIAGLTLLLTGPSPLAAQETPRIDQLWMSTDDTVRFAISGPDVGLYWNIRVIAEDGTVDKERVDVRMRRARGGRLRVVIRTDGALPGRYLVELADAHGNPLPADLAVIVAEGGAEETPEANDELVAATEAEPMASSVAVSLPENETDPACHDGVNRYVDCGDNTVRDSLTGLFWLRNANCADGLLDHDAAAAFAAWVQHGECGLTDNSSPGDWRLPTKQEWIDTVADAKGMYCNRPCRVNALGTGCYEAGQGVFAFMQGGAYWSNTVFEEQGPLPFERWFFAWYVQMASGDVSYKRTDTEAWVWPVRGGLY